jgi:hypothetical protein
MERPMRAAPALATITSGRWSRTAAASSSHQTQSPATSRRGSPDASRAKPTGWTQNFSQLWVERVPCTRSSDPHPPDGGARRLQYSPEPHPAKDRRAVRLGHDPRIARQQLGGVGVEVISVEMRDKNCVEALDDLRRVSRHRDQRISPAVCLGVYRREGANRRQHRVDQQPLYSHLEQQRWVRTRVSRII